jgi:hypothetical protein
LGVAGLLVVVVTSGLTALAELDWLISAKIGAFGFGGFLAWMIWVSTLILQRGGLPDALAWFGVATAGVVGMAVAMSIRFIRIPGSLSGNVQPPVELWVVFGIGFLSADRSCRPNASTTPTSTHKRKPANGASSNEGSQRRGRSCSAA